MGGRELPFPAGVCAEAEEAPRRAAEEGVWAQNEVLDQRTPRATPNLYDSKSVCSVYMQHEYPFSTLSSCIHQIHRFNQPHSNLVHPYSLMMPLNFCLFCAVTSSSPLLHLSPPRPDTTHRGTKVQGTQPTKAQVRVLDIQERTPDWTSWCKSLLASHRSFPW